MLELPHALQRPFKNTVALHNFEGPLDLLLYLIEKNELPIEEVTLTQITKPYLEALRALQASEDALQMLDGEFFVLAATLVLLKSRRLLPAVPEDESSEALIQEPGSDPTWSLIEQLVQYKNFKEKSKALARCLSYEQNKITRKFIVQDAAVPFGEKERFLAPIAPGRLKALWDKMQLRLQQKMLFEHFGQEFITVSDQMDWLLERLQVNSKLMFQELWGDEKTDKPIFSTFLATLELTRQQKTAVEQAENFEALWVHALIGKKP